jgi:two-component system, NarL family, sensor histidine kinase UhpB
MRAESSQSDFDRGALRRDLGIVVLVLLVAGWLFAYLELNEWLFARTRQWEALQLDELPAVLVVLATSLAWFAWRRYQDARVELTRRQAAEGRLTALLLENRRLAQQSLRAQESERKSVARELHDELGQYLNAIKTDAVLIQEKVADSPPAVLRALLAIIQHTDHLHAVVRDLIRELRPVALDDLGLRAALEHYLGHCQQRMPGVQFAITLEGDLDTLGELLSLTIYRLIQEGMTNVFRHAGATRVEIHVVRRGLPPDGSDTVSLSITDDGRGADRSETRSGLGLIGMRERVEMFGGHWRVTSAPGQGFSVEARIPINNHEAAITP